MLILVGSIYMHYIYGSNSVNFSRLNEWFKLRHKLKMRNVVLLFDKLLTYLKEITHFDWFN